MTSTSEITVRTGSRLHFGLLAYRPSEGREFGGVGLMIDDPGFAVRIKTADENTLDVPEVYRERVSQLVVGFEATSGLSDMCPVQIQMDQWYLPHVGLGSGTQLGLAIAAGIPKVHGLPETDATALASLAGRGKRSAIGIHGFQRGGLLADGGKRDRDAVSPLVSRLEFPQEWPILLVIPQRADGISGERERTAFERLPAMSAELTQRLCKVVLMELLPAVAEASYQLAGDAIYRLNHYVGDYFASEQGGTYADARMNDLANRLRQAGVPGVGQSSWGPTFFAICPNEATAEQIVVDLTNTGDYEDCAFKITRARNVSAEIV